MQIAKHKLVNVLFLLGFPCYGIGSYLSVKVNFSVGVIFGIAPFLAILLFWFVDLLFKGRVVVMVNRFFWLCFGYLLYVSASYWIGLHNRYITLNPINTASLSVAVVVPFLACVVVQVYNRANERFTWANTLLTGIGLLIGMNLLAYGAGFRSVGHGFEGRINLPFIAGVYDGAHMYAVIVMMLLFHLGDFMKRPVKATFVLIAFLLALALIMNANSRLSIMILFALLVLFVTGSIRRVRGLYAISLFTMPLLMSFTLLVYEILSLPVFRAILGRVDKEDVTTFNGRTHIWESVWYWLVDDRRGLIFGNGHMGQAHIGLLKHMSKLWEGDYRLIHMHSTFLQDLMDQGVLVLVLKYVLMYFGFMYYRKEFMKSSTNAPLYGAMVYLLFIWQIDIFCYGVGIGAALLYAVLSGLCLQERYITRAPATMLHTGSA